MFKSLRRTVAIAATLAALVVSSLYSAGPVSAAYYTNCSATEDNYIWHQWHTPGSRSSAKATTTIRGANSCIDANGNEGASLVMVVNLEDSDCNPFVQLGYGRFADFGLDFVFTPNHASCGEVARLRDFFSGVPAAVAGDTWTFTIGYDGSGPSTNYWTYRLQKSGGATYTFQRFACALTCDGDASKVWWGIETWNVKSQFGGAGSAKKVTLSNLAYSSGDCCDTEPSWTYSVVLNNDWATTGGAIAPSYYVDGGALDGNGRSTVTGYTSDH